MKTMFFLCTKEWGSSRMYAPMTPPGKPPRPRRVHSPRDPEGPEKRRVHIPKNVLSNPDKFGKAGVSSGLLGLYYKLAAPKHTKMVVCKPRCAKSSGKALTASRAYYDGMSKALWTSGYNKKEMKPAMQHLTKNVYWAKLPKVQKKKRKRSGEVTTKADRDAYYRTKSAEEAKKAGEASARREWYERFKARMGK